MTFVLPTVKKLYLKNSDPILAFLILISICISMLNGIFSPIIVAILANICDKIAGIIAGCSIFDVLC